ncbi:leucine-rich repeat domain-containing protein [Prevotella falsenii]|uniref:leucine-rich repeat domain-containing protein n=1 Tax=Prevotella falsenii TaxID=515414 RepID=UPI001E4F2EBE|nr:leucine-rich repeat domain-containing protein [Prevotella falsenii]
MNKVGMLAFGHCTKLREITVPHSVTDLEDFAFYGCKSLEKAVIKADISELKQYMFSTCTALKEVSLPASIEYIRTWAFDSCVSIKNITLPEKLKGIEANTFNSCEMLTEITFPASLEEIGSYVFDGCKQLKTVTCLRETPLEGMAMGESVFESIDKTKCELKVPKGHKAEYAAAEQWKDFTNITEHELTGISLPVNQNKDLKTSIFTINGQHLPANAQPTEGIYIINGKKMYVK